MFKDKVIAITGGSEGIGKALVDILIIQGAKIATCGRNADKLYGLKTTHANVPKRHCVSSHLCLIYCHSTYS